MASLRQALKSIGKNLPCRVPGDLESGWRAKSLRKILQLIDTQSDFTEFRVADWSRHPKRHNGYDSVTHQYRDSYIHAKTWTLLFECGNKNTQSPRLLPGNSGPTPQQLLDIKKGILKMKGISGFDITVEKQVNNHFVQVAKKAKSIQELDTNDLDLELGHLSIDVPKDESTQVLIRVSLTVHLGGRSISRSQKVYLQEFLVVSLGDSFAAGMGNPDFEGISFRQVFHPPDCLMKEEAIWQENTEGAHRSYKSGPSRAIQNLEEITFYDENGTLHLNCITFLTFAFSGAKTKHLYLDPQAGWQGVNQVLEAQRAVGERPIDALLISIGGNDTGFPQGLQKLMAEWKDPLQNWISVLLGSPSLLVKFILALVLTKTVPNTREEIRTELQNNLKGLLPHYENLALYIDLYLSPREIYITEYPLGFFDYQDGSKGGCGIFAEIEQQDIVMVKEIGQQLNQIISEAVQTINKNFANRPANTSWFYIDGIDAGFAGHGYCDSDSFFVSCEESCLIQGDLFGTMHPNAKGHSIYARQIAKFLQQNTLAKGSSTSRLPLKPPNPPYELSASSGTSVYDFRKVHIYWMSNSLSDAGYELERRRQGENSFVWVASINAHLPSTEGANYEDTIADGLGGQTYEYRVRAYNRSSYSAYSQILTVTLTKQVQCKFSSNSLSFGNVVTKDIETLWLTISNIGTCILEIEIQASPKDSSFLWSNVSEVLSPGSQCQVQVDFAPTALGFQQKSLTVTINTSGETSQTHQIQLSGTGIRGATK